MRTEPLSITGLDGPVVVESSLLGNKPTLTVGGHPAARTGRGRYALPAAGGGTVEATVRGGFLDAFPTLEINGVKHRTGPPTPLALRILAVVPIALVAVGGLFGALIGVVGVAVNMAVARQNSSTVVKALLMVGVLVVALVVWLIIAATVLGTTRT